MGRQKPQRPAANITKVLTPNEPAWRENNRWVEARAQADCLYDEDRLKKIEETLPCESTLDKVQFRPRLREIAVDYIYHFQKKAEAARNTQERVQLENAATQLNDALGNIRQLDRCNAGRWLPDAARNASVALRQIEFFLPNGESVLKLLSRAKDDIPTPNRGRPESTVPAQRRLLHLFHEANGRSALSSGRASKSSDGTCEEVFDEFTKFANAFFEPLREAGFDVPDPSRGQAAKLLNRRRKPRRRKR